MITEREIVEKLKNEGAKLLPMTLELENTLVSAAKKIIYRTNTIDEPDAFLKGTYRSKEFLFVAEIKCRTSSKIVLQAADQALRMTYAVAEDLGKVNPLVIAPWLSEENLDLLEKEGVSGIDLSGNGIITIPGEVIIVRTGKPNKYPDSRVVRNVYNGATSLVARAFLLSPKYKSSNDILHAIHSKNGKITQPTISKAVSQLIEDLIISKDEKGLRLLQPSKLMDKLTKEFVPPKLKARVKMKLIDSPVGQSLTLAAAKAGQEIVLTGAQSADLFTSFVKEPISSFYVSGSIQALLNSLYANYEIDSRFPNVELLETEDPTVFFDSRNAGGPIASSIVQSWLELSAGDKRQQDAAKKIEEKILSELEIKLKDSV